MRQPPFALFWMGLLGLVMSPELAAITAAMGLAIVLTALAVRFRHR